MVFRYRTGEEAQAGDRIKYHGGLGEVEFVALGESEDPAIGWYVKEYPPGGIMIIAEGFGRVFLQQGTDNEDLEFVRRKQNEQHNQE